ncbi:MAG: hypothetical protein IJF88_05755 [Oscillospiraceae bacterium]|nr:hypothetical protein [Oscillospiraceae bacterium]
MSKDTTQAASQTADPVYTAAELAKASENVFGVSPDITTAALRMANIQVATIAQAEMIVKEFANKEVK